MSQKRLPAYRYRITVVRVIDGDTLECDVDLGFYARIRTRLRLYGINCPELNTPEGKAARAYTVSQVTIGIESHPFELTADTLKPDKYGNRWDAIVYLPAGTSLNQVLVDAGHAVHVEYGKWK